MIHNRSAHPRRGSAYVVALMVLAIFGTLALAFASFTSTNLHQSDNYRSVGGARLAAESGLAYMLQRLNVVRLPNSTTAETLIPNLATALGSRLNGTATLGGQTVTNTATEVCVPEIQLEQGSFSCRFNQIGADLCRMAVCGTRRGVSRTITMDLEMVATPSAVFDYGLASRGQIIISGNATIVGVNYPTEANVLSATTLHNDAVRVEGSGVTISGDLFAAGDNAYVEISGSPSIAGSNDPDEWAEHVHIGVDAPEFPDMQLGSVASYATYTLLPTDPTNKGVLTNVRIPAGMNPVFSSDIVLNGVICIETPNIVKFTAKTTINGMIVTEDSGNPLDGSCKISFDGQVEAFGVEALPDTPQFDEVKQYTGTFIAAPGFDVTFAGHFSAINGTIAADKLTFTGTAEGVITGSVIGLEDYPTTVSGNVDIYVDRLNAGTDPAGFVKLFALVPKAGTYAEPAGGG